MAMAMMTLISRWAQHGDNRHGQHQCGNGKHHIRQPLDELIDAAPKESTQQASKGPDRRTEKVESTPT